MATKKNRKDSKGRVLKPGEYEKKSTNRYEYRWTDSVIGREHSIYADSLTELREKEAQIQHDAFDGLRPEGRNMTLNDVFVIWEKLKRQSTIRDTTLQNYIYLYRTYVEKDFGKRTIQSIRKSDIRLFYAMIREQRGLALSTIDGLHTVLLQLFSLGYEDGLVRQNVCSGAFKEFSRGCVSGGKSRRHALTRAQQENLEKYIFSSPETMQWWPIICVMLYAGLRIGEAAGLRWEDVDFDKKTISVNHTLIYYCKQRGEGKNAANIPTAGINGWAVHDTKTEAGCRIVPMLPIVEEALLTVKKNQEEFGFRCTASVDGYSNFIFSTRFGTPQHQGTVNKAIRRIVRDCNLELLRQADMRGRTNTDAVALVESCSCHVLRHTFATRAAEQNINISVLQKIMGHSDPATTLGIYVEAQEDFVREEMERLGRTYEGVPQTSEYQLLYQDSTRNLSDTMKSYGMLSGISPVDKAKF